MYIFQMYTIFLGLAGAFQSDFTDKVFLESSLSIARSHRSVRDAHEMWSSWWNLSETQLLVIGGVIRW